MDRVLALLRILCGLLPRSRTRATREGLRVLGRLRPLRWEDAPAIHVRGRFVKRITVEEPGTRRVQAEVLVWPWQAGEIVAGAAAQREAAMRARIESQAQQILACARSLNDSLGRRYVSLRQADQLRKQAAELAAAVEARDEPWLDRELATALQQIADLLVATEDVVARANASFVTEEAARLRQREPFAALTDEQLQALLTDEDATLVVAAAGSGKTRVIEAKVRYAVQHQGVPPDAVLVVAFNRTVAEELSSRLEASGLGAVSVRTFHSLGLRILQESANDRVRLSTLADPTAPAALAQFIERHLAHELRTNPDRAVADFLKIYLQPIPDESGLDQADPTDRRQHEESLLAPLGMSGRRVKSFGEYLIASFLFENQVPFEYERQYPHSEVRHCPDFTIEPKKTPAPNLFIEYFGTDRQGMTRPDIDPSRYRESMKWKQEVHEANGTTLISLYYYQLAELGVDRFRALLQRELASHGITLSPLPSERLVEELEQGRLPRLVALLVTFLRLYKGSVETLESLEARVDRLFHEPIHRARARMFLRIFARVLGAYEKRLSEEGATDFEDMIALGAQAVSEGRWTQRYTHVLVDEFQDISPLRALLLLALLRARPDARLFAVGDDFQAIYRFAGSQVRLMTEFGNTFGRHARRDLTYTHRFPAELANASTYFVLKNPSQLRKNVRGREGSEAKPIMLIRTDGQTYPKGVRTALHSASQLAVPEGKKVSVLLLGRYRSDEPADLEEIQRRAKRLSVRFSTIHQAKGLEADAVVLLNVVGGGRGFPARLNDDPLMQLLLDGADAFRDAEERRLFYVALTRARHHAFIVSRDDPSSVFCNELLGAEYAQWVSVIDLRGAQLDSPCPGCRDGQLVERSGRTGAFLGCTNFPYCLVTRPL